ncbi:MAG TPA: LysM peptidoglycan-binding domain-containing protein [Ramlibacter sp.]|uniref:LysM peptidoglycan-binding domain-containing protein n=1 Tax=Ramlibacter sp. TaxID=1917967 RepID=UPI002D7F5DD9|nr:LysM peptidoglycan-binding domain-containing protein [Ramlibacter sp.]HET8746186.1 LysM peptidoglycan-binding domain-containing protein [Ramlibacter sp.]
MKMSHSLLLLAALAGLAACQQAPLQPSASAPAPASAAPAEPLSAVPDTALAAPSPAPAPAPMPVTPASQQQAQRTALSAVAMLEAGHEAEARTELERALAQDPNNKLALNLKRQIEADPVTALGRESFNYTVRPNESLSMIAGRFLGDIYAFYILARYNGIPVPRQVAGGQTLKIPGKAPPPVVVRETPRPEPVTVPPTPAVATPAAPPEPGPGERAMRAGEEAERRGALDEAFDHYMRAAGLHESGASGKAERLRKQLVQRHSLVARTALAKQDLDAAIRAWERVLVVDPGNDTARLERQRALALKEKAKKL